MFELAAARDFWRRGLEKHQRTESHPLADDAADEMEQHRPGNRRRTEQEPWREETHDGSGARRSRRFNSRIGSDLEISRVAPQCTLKRAEARAPIFMSRLMFICRLLGQMIAGSCGSLVCRDDCGFAEN